MNFDRVLAILALIVALTGGVPTLMELLDRRAYFEVITEGYPDYEAANHTVVVSLPTRVINATDRPLTVFAIGFTVADENGETLASDSVTYWRDADPGTTVLPVRLEPSDSLLLSVPVAFPVPASAAVAEFNKAKGTIGEARELFRETYFPEAETFLMQVRAACDEIGMERGVLSRCIRLTAAVGEQRVAEIGELAVSFFPLSKENP